MSSLFTRALSAASFFLHLVRRFWNHTWNKFNCFCLFVFPSPHHQMMTTSWTSYSSHTHPTSQCPPYFLFPIPPSFILFLYPAEYASQSPSSIYTEIGNWIHPSRISKEVEWEGEEEMRWVDPLEEERRKDGPIQCKCDRLMWWACCSLSRCHYNDGMPHRER